MEPGKGILAADESGGSIHKKFETMFIPDDEQHRRDYRNIFFTTPELEKYVSGVILFDETARQTADNGKTFVEYLNDRGVIPGIKVDQGLVNFENSDEKYTQGLDGLPDRLKEYYDMGARFAKWRAAFEVTDHSPSDMAIQKNCEILASYASDCQAANIVPIVEPELVYDGDYPIEKNIEYTGKILDQLFVELEKKQINLAGCILKVNMVLAGKRQEKQSTPEEVGHETAKVLREHVPSELAGVVFLSGGQSVTQATDNLQAVTNEGPIPWPVTFSFARALQDPALQAWQGNNENADAAREAFRLRLVANAEALIKK
jgi:fructose-bisphosphate aldolase class I